MLELFVNLGKALDVFPRKGLTYSTEDEKGRKYEHVILDVKKLPEGATVIRAKSKPIGIAVLECGHKVPIFSYDLAEQLDEMICYRCSREESKKQGKKVRVRRKKVDIKLKYA